MNDDQLNDLKQFIVATVAQATAGMPTREDFLRLEQKLEQMMDNLEQKMDDRFAGIGEAIEQINDRHTEIAGALPGLSSKELRQGFYNVGGLKLQASQLVQARA